MNIRVLLIFTLFSTSLLAQKSIGQWNEYLSYRETNIIADGENKMYAASESVIFSLDLNDNSIERYSSVNGLSDKGISSMKWNTENKTLVVGYKNGNVDFLTSSGVVNFSDIKRSAITNDKTIRNIFNEGNFIWLSCGFGIVKVNVAAREVVETYIIGPVGTEIVVNSTLVFEGKAYAATELGLMEADLNTPLQDFNNWTFVPGAPLGNYDHVFEFGDVPSAFHNEEVEDQQLWELEGNTWVPFPYSSNQEVRGVAVGDDRIGLLFYNYVLVRDADHGVVGSFSDYQFSEDQDMNVVYFDSTDRMWIGDHLHGLLRHNGGDNYTASKLESPYTDVTWNADAIDNHLWIAHGAIENDFASAFSSRFFSGSKDLDWTSYGKNDFLRDNEIFDIVDVAINPNNPEQVFFAAWDGGLVEKKPDGSLELYRADLGNAPIQFSEDADDLYRVGGLDYDNSGNLWMTNSTPDEQIIVRKTNGDWKTFGCSSFTTKRIIGDLLATSAGQIWVLNNQAGDGALVVYDYNETIDNTNDDQCKKINTNENNGGLPNSGVLSVAEDLDGEIWIGTGEGPAIIYSPEFLFDPDPPVAQQIKIEQDGNVEIVLATASITAIAVDGANRKWLGTLSSGVFLLSEDGTETIEHFTAENSPLLSNTIKSITINDKTGEVFFGTNDGLISFVNDATLGLTDSECFKVFPNPVRPDYSGPIAIEGMVRDSNVKITDIAGNIVYETTSRGGRSTWDGTNFTGERVQSGVYLALVTSRVNEIESSCVAKILFIN